jgi:hypothetical protein
MDMGLPDSRSAPKDHSISRWHSGKEKNMSNNKDKKIGTRAEQPRNTELLSDILPLPEPRFHGRIGNTYADSEADIISVPTAPAARPT